jgi:hypothetical protein
MRTPAIVGEFAICDRTKYLSEVGVGIETGPPRAFSLTRLGATRVDRNLILDYQDLCQVQSA